VETLHEPQRMGLLQSDYPNKWLRMCHPLGRRHASMIKSLRDSMISARGVSPLLSEAVASDGMNPLLKQSNIIEVESLSVEASGNAWP